MPGAPNRPPATTGPAPPPVAATPAQRVLRRIVPARVALRLELWKGVPSPDLLTPFAKAETAFVAGEFREAEGFLDSLATRFAEPRWPTMPEPYRSLRARIVQPQPPHWDPEFTLAPEEKEARRARVEAEKQLALAHACVEDETRRGTSTEDLRGWVAEARSVFEREGGTASFWTGIDRVWEGLRSRVPSPEPARPAPVPKAPAAETSAEAA